MHGSTLRCPRCAGNLFFEHDVDGRHPLPELVCLQCGWRRALARQPV